MTDPLLLTGLLCSRLCHDLVGPVGALVNGVELLTDIDDGDDEDGLRDQSLTLLGESAAELSARLRLFRLAFGAAADGASVGHDELAEVLLPVMQGRRVAATIEGAREGAPRGLARLALLMAIFGADCLPRGGKLVVTFEATGGVSVALSGDRLALPVAHATVLDGDESEIEARTAPVAYALRLAAVEGRRLTAEVAPTLIRIVLA